MQAKTLFLPGVTPLAQNPTPSGIFALISEHNPAAGGLQPIPNERAPVRRIRAVPKF